MSSFTRPLTTRLSDNLTQRVSVILPFDRNMMEKKRVQSCIFCGQTLKIQTFKGKAVCMSCLQIIPSLFPAAN